ncbi:hypothetical protein [Algisphaera agarilytica]|uniref:Uncharacterized protein n=1 Tax=Algisphaera agarilytica TaxID=1385975 RepID=A0A7X0H677_9BACT|nr:hypothetical protein [Algisphaera agarilytica]MBB6430032.1 hypothetical protein [Algisphaera agarilytica]
MKEKLNDLLEWCKRDKKQTGMVLGLMAVGMLLWGRLILKQAPQTASADDKPAWLVEAEADMNSGPKEVITLAEPPKLERDPFILDPNRYKRTLSEQDLVSGAKLDEGLTDEAKRMAVVDAAAELQLQSVTLGDVPAAFINGRLIRIGESIEGFELLTCDERSAVLEKQGIRVRLGM